MHANTSSYYKTVLVNTTPSSQSSVTFWDVQGILAFRYAASKHLELALSEVVYQDTHSGGNGYDVPSDLSFAVKLGSYGRVQSRFRVGLLFQGRLPLAKHHNIPLEPYSSGRFEAGLFGLISYSSDLLIPEAGFNAHLNLGFWHHNDVGKTLTARANDKIAVLDPTRQFLWGLGVVFPSNQFDFSLELFGRLYAVRPPVTAYSREDYTYLTPSVLFRLSNRLSFTAGMDIRLSEDKDKTDYSSGLPQIHADMPSHPGWRVRFGARIHMTHPEPREIEKPLFSENRSSDASEGIGAGAAATLQERLMQERRETEVAEEELEKIRADRKKMEQMLARLREILRYGKATTEVTGKDDKEKKKVTKKNN